MRSILDACKSKGRRIARYLVGFWELKQEIATLRSTALTREHVKEEMSPVVSYLDQIHASIEEHKKEFAILKSTIPTSEHLKEEVDRLDGYLVYHMDQIHVSTERLGAALRKRPDRLYSSANLDAVLLVDDHDLIIPSREIGLLGYILRHGVSSIEPGVTAVLRNHLKPGSVAVDAGANIGLHSLTMASAVGPDGRVLCFEPAPHLAATLRRTLRLNGYGGFAQVEQAALSDSIGQAVLHCAAHGPMSSVFPLLEAAECEAIPIKTTTLDEFVGPGSRVDLVKADVEGSEPRLWRGMRRVLQDNADIKVIMEWSASHFRRSGEDPETFMTEIRSMGFVPRLIEDAPPPGLLTPLTEGVRHLEGKNLLLSRSAGG